MQAVLQFLTGLQANNNREWFQVNREEYEKSKKEFASFINQLIARIAIFDPQISGAEAKDCIFRINRDTRFSNDKTPYKTNMGAFIAAGGRKSPLAGYYVHLQPGESFLSGGIYMPQPDVLKTLRTEIFENTEEFLRILNQPEFKNLFGYLWGDKLQSAPKGFPRDYKYIDLLKFKHYAVVHTASDAVVTNSSYLESAEKIFKMLHPFNQFLNQAILRS